MAPARLDPINTDVDLGVLEARGDENCSKAAPSGVRALIPPSSTGEGLSPHAFL